VVEGALKTTNTGAPNFKTFGTQLNRIPADYRAELYTLPQNQTLRDISTTSNLLSQDFNPSGSATMGQTALEAGAIVAAPFHPVGALGPLLQYPVAKLMNSPAIVERLMKPAVPLPVPRSLRIAAPVLRRRSSRERGE
jgi:hypothetical protein